MQLIAKDGEKPVIACGHFCVHSVSGVARKTFKPFDRPVVLDDSLNAEACHLGEDRIPESDSQERKSKAEKARIRKHLGMLRP